MIEIKKLSFSYKNNEDIQLLSSDNNVLNDINLKINDGEFIAVLGHNGSGKSTLAKIMNGILLPTDGDCFVDGMNTKDESKLISIRSNVGMVFQNPDNQMVAAVVEDDVAFAPENLGVPSDEIRNRVDKCLKTVGMFEFRREQPAHLSGGQKQRVAIASVLAMEPKYIILDEPTAMLDPVGREEVISTIKQLNKEQGVTIVLITHYMEEAAAADRIVVVDGGEILMDDKPIEVFRNIEELKRVGLDVPQSTELAFELRKRGFDIPHVITPDECAKAIAEKLGVKI